MKPQLGQVVRDLITGFEGIVIGEVAYITGCNQCLVQPPCKASTGDFVESRWVDVDRLTVLDVMQITLPKHSDGADKPAPRR